MKNARLKIWFIEYDEDGNVIGRGVYNKDYMYYGTAKNVAEKYYGDKTKFKYTISLLNPFEKHYETHKCEICGKEYEVELDCNGYTYDNFLHLHDAREKSGHRMYVHDVCCYDCVDNIRNYIESLKGE